MTVDIDRFIRLQLGMANTTEAIDMLVELLAEADQHRINAAAMSCLVAPIAAQLGRLDDEMSLLVDGLQFGRPAAEEAKP